MPNTTKYKTKWLECFKTHVENPNKMFSENTKVNNDKINMFMLSKLPMDAESNVKHINFRILTWESIELVSITYKD